MSTNLTDQIRSFIFENFLFDAAAEDLKNDASFLETGIIDSTGILELVEWMEETFGISVNDEELVPENFDSVSRLEAYLQGKKAEAA